MNMQYITIIILLSTGFSAQAKECYLSHNPDKTILTFNAYKNEPKITVPGTLNILKVSNIQKALKISDALKSAKVEIDVLSIATGISLRDNRLKKYIFEDGKLVLTGKVIKTNPKLKQLVVRLNLNKKSRDVIFYYELKNKQLELKTTIDMANFLLSKKLKALSKVCFAEIWTNLDISITSEVTKLCK